MTASEDGLPGLFGTWQTEAIGAEPVPHGVTSTVTFADDGTVHGDGGVNTFRGSFKTRAGEVEIGSVAATLKAGLDPAASSHEARLFAVLNGTRPFAIDDDVLTIGTGDDTVRFRRLPAGHADGAGGSVDISGSVTYRQRIALPPGAVVTVALRTCRSPTRRPRPSPSWRSRRSTRCRSRSR